MEAAAVLKQCPPEHREWVDRLRHGGSMPLSSIPDTTSNSWACAPGDLFYVRGADYMKNKTKVPAGDWLLQPLAFDFLQSSSQISHIMNHPQCRVRTALDAALAASDPSSSEPFVWVFNVQLGNKTHHSMVYYFVTFSSPPPGSLMQKFLDGDDSYRNSHLKLLLRLPEAPWLVQMVVGERWPVCLMGKVVTCRYKRGKNYIEMDVDSGSAVLTRAAVKVAFGLAPLIVSDIAFLLEGNHPDELPERILGALRQTKMEPSSAPFIDMSLVSEGDGLNYKQVPSQIDMMSEVITLGEVNGNNKHMKGVTVKFSRLWSSSSKDVRKVESTKHKRSVTAEEEERGSGEGRVSFSYHQ
ncbi:hypothetical protein GOP47_0025112 [Adiantum capillus-veneris]|uniref:Protein ENHANCED DISEASE RESISTANCE 2 C-terminal domain-containing protein n=1 Tax=Adiantum capillus-veneris TaxID=13818 RepID=A0A9D4U3G6_ADICA|nr:hypothetical protein GOP47_0025112 [Adiantum capillus-veneris]